MPTAIPSSPPASRTELQLTFALRHILQDAADKPLTLGLIIDSTGTRASGILMAFICLPFIQPIPLPGLSIPFGLALFLLGLQVSIRKDRPWLPRRLLNIHLPQKFGTRLIHFLTRVFKPLEKIIRPRLLIMQNTLAMVVVGAALCIDGLLLTILPAFPGSNLIPAWIAMIKILGITEKDGVCLMIGSLLTFAAIAATIIAINMGWHKIASLF